MELEEKVFELAEKDLGNVSSVEEVSSGLVHSTFFVSAGGEDFVVQISDSDEDRKRAVRRKVKVYELAGNYEVNIPKLVKGVESFSFIGEERLYYIVEKALGSEMDEGFKDKVIEQVGQELASIHEMESFKSPGWLKPVESGFEQFNFDEGNYTQWLIINLNRDLQVLKENGFDNIAEKLEKLITDLSKRNISDFDPVLCHNDYGPDNILSKNGEITAVIDFDYIFSSDPRRDLVKAANSFEIEKFKIRDELYQSYLQKKQLKNFEQVEPFYRLETSVKIIASHFKLKEDVEEHEIRKFKKILNESINYYKEKSEEIN